MADAEPATFSTRHNIHLLPAVCYWSPNNNKNTPVLALPDVSHKTYNVHICKVQSKGTFFDQK